METTKPKRFSDALSIQGGAVNVQAIANSLLNACREIRAEWDSGKPREMSRRLEGDPAVRLIIHQLAFLARVYEIEGNATTYGELTAQCERVGANLRLVPSWREHVLSETRQALRCERLANLETGANAETARESASVYWSRANERLAELNNLERGESIEGAQS